MVTAVIMVKIGLVDGGYREYEDSADRLVDLQALQSQGYEGKRLIDRLFGDDWGAPPLFIEVCWTAPDGQAMKERVPYC